MLTATPTAEHSLLLARAAHGALPASWPLSNAQYAVEAKLGTGTFGAVYSATRSSAWERPSRCALKVLPRSSTRRSRELEIMLAMRQYAEHPSVLSLHEHFYTESPSQQSHHLVLVLPLYDGSLADFIYSTPTAPKATPLPQPHAPATRLAAARHVGRQLASALAHVHALSIVHRDVKPDNVLLRHLPSCPCSLARGSVSRTFAAARAPAPTYGSETSFGDAFFANAPTAGAAKCMCPPASLTAVLADFGQAKQLRRASRGPCATGDADGDGEAERAPGCEEELSCAYACARVYRPPECFFGSTSYGTPLSCSVPSPPPVSLSSPSSSLSLLTLLALCIRHGPRPVGVGLRRRRDPPR